MARAAGRLRGDADRERAGGDLADDVRVGRDDRLGADPRARVEHRSEPDLCAILEHDRREAVLEPFEDGVPDVVRDDQRAHRQEDLTADQHGPADVDERLVADEREVADREGRPRVAVTAAAEPNGASAPDPRAEVGASAAQLEIGAELRELADRDDLLAHDGRARAEPNAVLDDDTWRHDERSLAEIDAVSDLRSRPTERDDLLVGRQRAERVVIERLEKRRIDHADGLVELERRRQRDSAGRHSRERRPGRRRGCGLLRDDQRLDVLLRDEPALLDRGEVDPVELGELGRLPRRLPVACSRFGAGFSSAFASIVGQLVGRLRDVRDRLAELDLDVLAVELHDRACSGRLHLDRRLRRLDDADGLSCGHLRAILDEPLREERVLGVRVLARENDLQHGR